MWVPVRDESGTGTRNRTNGSGFYRWGWMTGGTALRGPRPGKKRSGQRRARAAGGRVRHGRRATSAGRFKTNSGVIGRGVVVFIFGSGPIKTENWC